MNRRKAVLDDENGFAEHGGYMGAKISKLEEQFNTIQSNCLQKSKVLNYPLCNTNLTSTYLYFRSLKEFPFSSMASLNQARRS